MTTYASINSSGAHPPPPLSNRGTFAHVVSPGGWALAYPGATLRAFGTRVFERWMSLSERTREHDYFAFRIQN